MTNGGFGDCFYCINPNNWYTDLYPRLLELEEKGIEVICIAGDIGFRVHEFSYETPAQIQYLASGIDAGDPDNRALLFKHDLAGNMLSWEFIKLSELQIPESSFPMEESLPSIYPNPSSGVVHISADQGTISLWVYDILGRAVISGESPESGFIDLSNEPRGLYLFGILAKGRKMVWEKVLIQ